MEGDMNAIVGDEADNNNAVVTSRKEER